MRAREQASREYEGAWSEVANLVEAQIAAGESDPAHIVESAWSSWRSGFYLTEPFRSYYEDLGVADDADGTPTQKLIVHDGAYRLVPYSNTPEDVLVRELANHISSARGKPYDCVVELGSGCGRNLFRLHAALPRALQPDYHACELTAAGRSVTERLHGLAEGMRLQVHPFDYYAPDLGFLKGGERVLLFTCHSIEQIPVLGRQVFNEALRRSGSCTGFHLEPVGWQENASLRRWRAPSSGLQSDLGRWVAKRRRKLARRLQRTFSTHRRDHIEGIFLSRSDLGRSKHVSRNAAVWSRMCDFNTNLLPLLHDLEDDGCIGLDRVDRDLFGDNPFNPATFVAWHGVARG